MTLALAALGLLLCGWAWGAGPGPSPAPAGDDVAPIPLQHGVPLDASLAAGETQTYWISNDQPEAELRVYLSISGNAKGFLCRSSELADCSTLYLARVTQSDYIMRGDLEEGIYYIQVVAVTKTDVRVQAEAAWRPFELGMHQVVTPNDPEKDFQRFQYLVCPESRSDPELVINTNGRNDVLLYVTSEERYLEDPADCDTARGDVCGQSSVTIKTPKHGIYRIVARPTNGRAGYPFNLTIYDSDVVQGVMPDGKGYEEKICNTDGCALTMAIDISDYADHDNLLLSASNTNIASTGVLNVYAAMDINNINYRLSPTFNSTTGTLFLLRSQLDELVAAKPAQADMKLMVQLRGKMARVYPRDSDWETSLPFRMLAAYDVYESALYQVSTSTLSSAVPEVRQAWSFAGRAADRPYGNGVYRAYEVVTYYATATEGVLLGAYASTTMVPTTQTDGQVLHSDDSTSKIETASVLVEVGKDTGVAEGSTLFTKGFITSTGGSGALPDVAVSSVAGMVWELNETEIVTVPAQSSLSMFFRVRVSKEMITVGGIDISATLLGMGANGKGATIYASKTMPFPSKTVNSWKVTTSRNGQATLSVPTRKEGVGFEEGDYLYFNVQAADQEHSIEVYATPKGHMRVTEIEDGRITNFPLGAEMASTAKFMVQLSASYIMGYAGTMRRRALVELELNQQVNADVFTGATVIVAVTNQYYDGTAPQASAQVNPKNVLASRDMAISKGPNGEWLNSRMYIIADVRDSRPIYITVTRMTSGQKPISLRIIAGGFDALEEDLPYAIYLPRATGSRNFYSFESPQDRDWSLTMDAYKAPDSSYSVLICPRLPPMELDGIFEAAACLPPKALVPGTPLTIEYSAAAEGYVSGNYYIAIIANNAATDVTAHFSLRVRSTTRGALGAVTKRRIFGQKTHYFKYAMPDDEAVVNQEMNFYGAVKKCTNCAVCLSRTTPHPQFDPAAWKETGDKGECDVVLGRLQSDDEEYGPGDSEEKLYKSTGRLPVIAGADTVYGSLLSLDAEGVTDTVYFYGALERACEEGKDYVISLGQLKAGEFGNTDDGRLYYPRYHFQFPLYDMPNYASFSVGPVGTSKQDVLTTVYAYYVSFHDPCPDMSNAEYFGDYERGHNPLSFTKEQINGSTVVYVTLIATGDTMSRYVDTSVRFDTGEDSLIYPMGYMQYTPSPVVSTSRKRVYHFDASRFPLDVIMEPCRGYPVMRAGITDFFRRSDGDNSPAANKVEQEEDVYTVYNVPMFDEAVVRLRGGTRYSPGSWFFEVGDYRVTMANWSVSLFAASTDPRPAVPVGTLQVYGAGSGRLEVTFHPASPVNYQGSQSDLEYAVYGLPGNGAEEIDDAYWNYRASCGYLQGGVQLSDWTTFPDWDEFFTLKTNKKTSSVGPGDVWVAVLVRAKSTLLFRAFTPVFLSGGSAPASRTQTSGWVIALSVTLCVVVVVAVATGLTLFFLRRKARRDVKAHGEKVFLGLDRETLDTH